MVHLVATGLHPDLEALEEQFHMQYHSEASESGIADLAQLRQKRGEAVTEYIQRFRNLRNRCYSVRITEKEAIELAVAGLATPLKDMASQADYPSLAHMVQKLSAYEQRHPDLYKDKFKCAVVLVEAEEDKVSAGDQEVAAAEWTRGGTPVSCKWVKPPGPPRGFDFDVTKTEQIFDLLLKEKQLTIPEGLKFPTVQELNGKPYCKWHNSLSHATNDCRVWRQHIQAAIEKGRLIFNQYAMKVDTQPFPAVNMVECTYPEGCQPGSSFSINMVGSEHHAGKDGDEGSCSRSKDTGGRPPRDRLRHDGKRYVTEGEKKKEAANVSVFERLGPLPPQSKRAESLGGQISRIQKTRDKKKKKTSTTVQGGALMDSAVPKSAGFSDCAAWRKPKEGRPRKMEWRPKQRKADDETSAGTNMVLVLPTELSAPRFYDALKVDDSKRIKSEVGLVLSTSLTK
ncbi:hypothetical protein QYE76_028723 [Lolium multiflorum]|uniref:Retrotransposon gag domain-containing protein n=1 Tax=Lolium multiflorum TaxID=4521 RepID=A0AAD8QMH0_LOLMU|nr:hypothetical protein QYE76_028723 [Lolium multiflorum]